MAEIFRLSVQRPHLSLSPNGDVPEFACLQEPITTFTELLKAAQSVETGSSICDATPVSVSSVIQRRLRNRVSCRKTRLKRKLKQHSLDVLVRERQSRKDYLTQLASELRADDNRDHDALYREFATKCLHYALVDPAYTGWMSGSNSQVVSPTKINHDSITPTHLATRKSKRLRRAHDTDVSSTMADHGCGGSFNAQASLIQQWGQVIDGLQNVDLKLESMEECDLGAGDFDQCCFWKFVGVSPVIVQRDGGISAAAVTGITRVRFHGRCMQGVSTSISQREENIPFEVDATCSSRNGNDSLSSSPMAP
ncbi:unnamed protein product [Phytophthora lilii]|uniref:Unnamed protein product n=1 Tax=Phytophthora lilii TaxID=2077276 RepID=A0A9W7CPX3_9STRA|nr:unnamed protein product [Phytophthora lilii]